MASQSVDRHVGSESRVVRRRSGWDGAEKGAACQLMLSRAGEGIGKSLRWGRGVVVDGVGTTAGLGCTGPGWLIAWLAGWLVGWLADSLAERSRTGVVKSQELEWRGAKWERREVF